jgi:hypothetical protein
MNGISAPMKKTLEISFTTFAMWGHRKIVAMYDMTSKTRPHHTLNLASGLILLFVSLEVDSRSNCNIIKDKIK